jgi:chromosomal replication initiator protein
MDARQVWQAALERVQRRVSAGAFATWFSGTMGLGLSGRTMTVAVPSTFAREHLGQRFRETARIAVSEVIGQSADIAFVVREVSDAAPQAARQQAPRQSGLSRSTPAFEQQVAFTRDPLAAPSPRQIAVPMGGRLPSGASQPPLVEYGSAVGRQQHPAHARVTTPLVARADDFQGAATSHELHARYVFETFIVGTANQLAYAAAREVAAAPGRRYNPLLIYGGVGLGKTHLLHAIGHEALQHGLSVAYVTAERFTNEIIEAIRQRTTEAFRARYRAVDVLLVDDVQFIAGKESTEEEFFHTFNALHEADKQIVLTSDRVPQAMHHLHDRLRSRFQWGLIADVHAPDFQHRLAILRAKAAALPMPVPEDVLASLARPECESIRELEGTLNRVVAYAQMLRQPLDGQLVAQAIAPLVGEPRRRPVESGEVLRAVSEHYHVSMADLEGKSREHGVAWARQVAMYLLREETPASLLQIGQQLGGRDHTTVMHGCAQVGKALAHDDEARRELAAIRAALHT